MDIFFISLKELLETNQLFQNLLLLERGWEREGGERDSLGDCVQILPYLSQVSEPLSLLGPDPQMPSLSGFHYFKKEKKNGGGGKG